MCAADDRGSTPFLGPLADDLAAASLEMARRFAAGATMFCAAPEWPSHAQHLAVEFVHPVIVGKRALPAVAVDGGDLLGNLRVVAAPGDLFVAVARAGEPAVVAAMRRAPAWGVRSVWIGVGERPAAGSADHVLFLDEDEATVAYGGGFVLAYHVLWELTHVCFEHPGLLAAPAAGDGCDEGEVCITCSDEGRLAEVLAAGPGNSARVRTSSGIEAIDTTLIGAPRPGDLVLVHAGSAVTTVEG